MAIPGAGERKRNDPLDAFGGPGRDVGGRGLDGEARPRRNPPGFIGNDDDPREPTPEPRGLIDDARAAINANPISQPRTAMVPEGDERPRSPRPPKEEEPPLIPGDPNDFGARGRRRGDPDDETTSPVLRRGLLGV